MSEILPVPQGFRFASALARIKPTAQRPDVGLIVSEVPAACAGVFTRNKVIAAPLQLTRPRIATGCCQAVLVNSGNANACTGAAGLEVARHSAAALAAELGLAEELVAVASTGVIGVPLPLERLTAVLAPLCADLAPDQAPAVAQAIMTTDSFSKMAARRLDAAGQQAVVLGLAKGAGMIHPNMATMLGFVLTDARLAPQLLDAMLRRAVDGSFNSISVDGDTSTNDLVLVLANGAAGEAEILPGTAAAAAFQDALDAVLLDLAKMIVRDGEGATKLVRIQLRGARDAAQARQAAQAVATSNLVKTAFFGEDANWGRIIAAVGYSGAEVDPDRVDIFFDAVQVVRQGLTTGAEQEALATAVLKQPEFSVRIELHQGDGVCDYYCSDLTYDYVKINADYRT
ncbi:bifunctional glutamate N-acetyltransferase/amino-acid acetyltransferase ArgJ [Desulfuromonas thiophila]|uniref:bifunctional glutamate N-acetyltransferase/amino-acid acetyltransferase ArgJ n=1 Tax=Desulfuromonas thiophila TaxID=57664 RepID=UPI0024A99266|nr:bifunctional glutamate N-acetyltransferase/amino-acid acetyltransferase ArgJ [Desulfuromonas thiophila]